MLVLQILQHVLKLNLPKEILEEAVERALMPGQSSGGANSVKEILSNQVFLEFKNSAFLQLMFNLLLKSRDSIYQKNVNEKPFVSSVINEIQRSIRILFTQGEERNQELR